MSAPQEPVYKITTYEANAIAVAGWRRRHPPQSDAERLSQVMSQRLGDFEARHDRGTFYSVRCVRCSLKGTISIPDSEHARCPRCARVPLDEWQRYGWAGLLPPEPKRKPLQVLTADADDDIPVTEVEGEGVFDEDTQELSVDALVREADASVIDVEREGESEPDAVEEIVEEGE